MLNIKRLGYTLFELIAVLTVSGIIFTVVMGSWNSWSTVHATNGAAKIIKAEIHKARSLAMAKNRYVGFELTSHTINQVQHITSSQLYLSTNETGTVETLLDNKNFDEIKLIPATPVNNYSGHIRIESSTEISPKEEPEVILFFRPDGSIWNGDGSQYHYITVCSRKLFNTDPPNPSSPLERLLHIDLTTGAVNLIRTED